MSYWLDRSKARFTDSRLLRQGPELSAELLSGDIAEDPLRELAAVAFAGATSLELREARQLDRTIRQLANHLTSLAREGSAHQFIPAIHDAVPKFYTSVSPVDRNNWMGPALKLAAAFLWTEMAGRAIRGKSVQLLRDVVTAAGALDQALIMKAILASTVGRGEVTISSGTITWNDTFEEGRRKFYRAFMGRGTTQRIAPMLAEVVIHHFDQFVAMASDRIEGGLGSLEGDHGPLLTMLSGVKDQHFWAGILSRLLLMGLAIDASRRQVVPPQCPVVRRDVRW